jgi:hypothetical protein
MTKTIAKQTIISMVFFIKNPPFFLLPLELFLLKAKKRPDSLSLRVSGEAVLISGRKVI